MHFPTLICTRREHVRNARKTRDEIRALQLHKFRALVRHAQAHSPYYRQIIDERRIDPANATPADFPVLTKADFLQNFDAIVTDRSVTKAAIHEFLRDSHDERARFRGKYYVVHSSGTSGTAGFQIYSGKDWARGAAHAFRINPPSAGQRRMAFFAKSNGHPIGLGFANSTQTWPLSLLYKLAVFDIGDPVAGVVKGLNEFRPTILMGYPSTLALLAHQQRFGDLRVRPRWIQGSGEAPTAVQRAAIQEAFGVPYINVYSCTEHAIMGFARPDTDGMYLLEDDLIFETNPDHVLVTNLFNYTAPLIRYRMSDLLVPKEDTVNLFPFTKVTEVVGRGELVAFLKNRHGADDILLPFQITELFEVNVTDFQLHMTTRSSCILRVVLRPGLDADTAADSMRRIEASLRATLDRKEMTNVQLSVAPVAELPRDPSGKLRTVINAPA